MQALSDGTRRHKVISALGAISLFALYGVYVAFRIEPVLLWHDAPAVFVLDSRVFLEFATRVGGPAEYASALLNTLLVDRASGTLLLTGLCVSIALATGRLLVRFRGAGGLVLALAPGAFLLALMGLYSHPVELCLRLLVVLGAVLAYVSLSRVAWPWRLAVLAATSLLVCYAVGAFYVLYALLCAAVDWRLRRRPAWGLAWLACAAAAPAYAPGGFNVTAWLSWLPHAIEAPALIPITGSKLYVHQGLRLALLAFFPAVLVFVSLRRHTPATHKTSVPALALGATAVLALWTSAAWLSFDAPARTERRLAHAIDVKDWPAVLDLSRQLPPAEYRATGAYNVHRALFAQGRLLDDLFAFPQSASTPALLPAEDRYDLAMHRGDLLFDLGWVNGSARMAYEAIVVHGQHPRLLQRLIRLHVLRGRSEAALVYARHLHATLWHGAWADSCLADLQRDPTWSSDPLVASKRPLMGTTDYAGRESIDAVTQRLLARNPHNRMAFEYLMAHYLLTRSPERIAPELGRFKRLGYERIPRLCQEAAAVDYLKRAAQGAEAPLPLIDPHVLAQGREFARLVDGRSNAPIRARVRAYARYKDSYFYYHRFGRTSGQGSFFLSGDGL